MYQPESLFDVLRADGIVVVPTMLGYAALAITPNAVAKLYKLKKRPKTKKTGVLATPEIFSTLTTSSFNKAVAQFPYPVGFIDYVNPALTSIQALSTHNLQDQKLAFFFNLDSKLSRIAEYAWTRGVLVTVTSANRSGAGNCFRQADIHDTFLSEADCVIVEDNLSLVRERGEIDAVTSTIIDLTTGTVARQGLFASRIAALAQRRHLISAPQVAKRRQRDPKQMRSCIFVQAYRAATYKLLPTISTADCVVLDLEDGCPDLQKPVARHLIAAYCQSPSTTSPLVVVRLNGLSTARALEADLAITYNQNIHGFALPMLETAADVLQYEAYVAKLERKLRLPPNTFCFLPIIETPAALANAVEIANASARNVALLLGHADLFAALGAVRSTENLHAVRLQYLSAARQANVVAFDTPYEDVKDLSGLRRDTQAGKDIGLDGKVALTFDQLNVINRIYQLPHAERKRYEYLLSHYTGGCQIIDGTFVAPPIVKQMRRALATSRHSMNTQSTATLRGKSLSYGLDHDNAHVGQTVHGITDVTVDAAWLMNWQSLVQTSNPLETSAHFCTALGLEGRLLPFHLLVNLALCLQVEPFSESSLFHLGISDVVYEHAAYVGDTLHSVMHIDEIVASSSKDYSILKTRVALVNQNGLRVVSMRRNSLFPYLGEKPNAATDTPAIFEGAIHPQLRETLLEKTDNIPARLRLRRPQLQKHDFLLHGIARPLGLSNSVAFSTLYKNTHPVHINNARYGLDGLVVCGGFIIPIMHANASQDLGFALDLEIVDTMHINRVHHEDAIGAMTVVLSVEQVSATVECLTLRTFGVKNIDPQTQLAESDIPLDLLLSPRIKPKEINLLCNTYCPELSESICARMTWKMWRPVWT